MVATVTATSSALSGDYAQLQRNQARQAAEQAEVRAESLQRQAASARRDADRMSNQADHLQQNAHSANQDARRMRQGLNTAEGFNQLGQNLERSASMLANTVAPGSAPAASSRSTADTSPGKTTTLNAYGQTTGQLINVTA